MHDCYQCGQACYCHGDVDESRVDGLNFSCITCAGCGCEDYEDYEDWYEKYEFEQD